jgi:hypothetical protein
MSPAKKATKKKVWVLLVAGWTGWDSVATGFVMLCTGAVGMHLVSIYGTIEPWQMTQLIHAFGGPLVKLFGCLFFSAWSWSVARAPTKNEHKAEWGEMDWKQQIVTGLLEKYVSIALMTIAVIFAVSIAPDILTVREYLKD